MSRDTDKARLAGRPAIVGLGLVGSAGANMETASAQVPSATVAWDDPTMDPAVLEQGAFDDPTLDDGLLPSPNGLNDIIGSPESDALFFENQVRPDTCAVRCQELVLQCFSGEDVDFDVLLEEATESGWYVPGVGTPFGDLGNLLEAHGIPTVTNFEATPYDLAAALAQGRKVICAVDSGELWNPEGELYEDSIGGASADHALLVTGIDTTDPDNIEVIVSDPGGQTPMRSYPLDQFIDAWGDSRFQMVSTTQPPPLQFNPELVNFDYDAGHLPEVCGLPWEEFTEFDQKLDDFRTWFDQVVHDGLDGLTLWGSESDGSTWSVTVEHVGPPEIDTMIAPDAFDAPMPEVDDLGDLGGFDAC